MFQLQRLQAVSVSRAAVQLMKSFCTKTVSAGEDVLRKKLGSTFPEASTIIVEDISGGCGSMYQIYVESKEFKGLPTVKQHQLVTQALKEEIKEMHGLRINTKAVKDAA